MKWFEQNRWLGSFLIGLALVTLAALYFLFHARSQADQAVARFQETVMEKNRLERLDPFPTEANYRTMKLHLENYGTTLDKVKQELVRRVLPVPPLAPNEFQSHLRQAMLAVSEKARANQVNLPDNFALGFEEFTSALPATDVAPQLGQELSQIELLMRILVDARVDSVTSLSRVPVSAGAGPGATPARGQAAVAAEAGPKFVEQTAVTVTFLSAPSAARKVLNQIASSNQQFFIVRLLRVRNEKEKGPARERAAGQTATAKSQGTAAAKPAPNAVLNFIVGTEHIETSARIELVRFTF